MNEALKLVLTFLVSAIIFIPLGMLIYQLIIKIRKKTAESKAKEILERAHNEAENYYKSEVIKAREEALNIKKMADEEVKERRKEVSIQERRIIQKEEQIDRKEERQERKEKELYNFENELLTKEQELGDLEKQKKEALLKISQLTREEAKTLILAELEKELTTQKAKIIQEQKDEIKSSAEKEAKEVISQAIQKCAADHTSETTISVVSLPNDDMKGRIIGREGRNIKTLETLTGAQFIIDDTPESITVSAFDPIRREIARLALESLIEDGRIHPSKIEELVDKAMLQVEETIQEEGERAMLETGVAKLPPEMIKLLGKLKYRTSYGQNALIHSIEVSNLSKIMAEELGLNVRLAARAGLLHDIGKALDHDADTVGTHIELGVEVLRKYKEEPLVINAVEAHHDDVEAESNEALIVKAADAISASRPGARRDTFESYIKRLESLENIANSFTGVEKSYAIQAGREVRLIVNPEKITDEEMTVLAKDVVEKIENEMAFPGQIKINILRETRKVDYAKQNKKQ